MEVTLPGSVDFRTISVYVLDGGLGMECEKRVPNLLEDPLWNARLLHTKPQVLEDVHLSFMKGGADIIITASYQTSVLLLCEHLNIDERQALALIRESVYIVKRARKTYLKSKSSDYNLEGLPLVAGSIGPFGACLHNMSEYKGDYVDHMTEEELMTWHRPRIAALLEAGVDVLAIETIPAQAEAEAIVKLLAEFPEARAWVAFSCKDELHTCHGELFSGAISNICHSPQVIAMGINCTNPRFIEPLLKSAVSVSEKPFVVYPNGKDNWDTTNIGSWETSPTPLERDFPKEILLLWRSLGARIIGGCCHVNPSNIRFIKDTFFSVDNSATTCITIT